MAGFAPGNLLDPGAEPDPRSGESPAVYHEALSTLRAGFVLLDENGRPVSDIDPALVELGFEDFSADTLERLRHRAVDVDGEPLGPGYTPVFDAIFRDIQMNDVVIGFRVEEEGAEGGLPTGGDSSECFRWIRMDSRRTVVDGLERTMITAVDITQMRRAEERLRRAAAELRESERRYRDIVENAAEGVWVLDTEDRTAFVNAQMAQMLGRTTDELVGRAVLDFIPERDREAAAERLRRRRRGEQHHGEASFLAADGREVVTRLSAAPVYADDGSYAGALALVTDLTGEIARRRELEAAVAAEQRRFAVVFEHIGDIITVFDVDGQVKFGSPSGERILGWPAGHRAAGGILDLVHPDDRQKAREALGGVVDGSRGPTDATVLRIRTLDGEWRYMECVGVNMLDAPTIEGIVVTARDVTDRHRLTMELQHAATHDQLTGLPNRAMFGEHLVAALDRNVRRDSTVALCYLDVDGFKEVNDVHGHATGDLLLEEVGQRLRDCLRGSDVPSRLGGDEFGLILEGADEETALHVATRVRDRLEAPYEIGGVTISSGASIGLAIARAGDTAESWLERADQALYSAKRAGRHLVELAPDVPGDPVTPSQ